MKMGKKVREYKAGDFIFAKVKGYPAWPARVQRLNGKKYFVYFYGTAETANLPPNMIFDYAENKDKFLNKPVKRRDFNEGVKQIEYDFANNVPLEQVIGVPAEVDEQANQTVDESTANETMDESMADTTAVDETMAEENTTQNDTGIEDSDETGALVIDEGKPGKAGKKSASKTPAKETPKAKEPKTPRGRAKKEEEGKEEQKDEDKKEDEIVSRSGRKIRPKRYIDEHTEENTALPSSAKKRRGASPVEKDKDNKEKDKEKEMKEKDSKEKNIKHFNAVTQAELEDLKEPFTPEDPEKENIIIAYLPAGQYVGIKLFQSRPSSFKNEGTRLQWDKQAASNALTLKSQLEKGHITAQSVIAQLVMDLNLTDEEKATLDKDRETEEKKSRVNFLKVEMKLIELDAKIKTCLCLEKADTELCLKLLDELMELDIKPLMLLKHPTAPETIKRMRAYVGNTPSWELTENAALLFSQHAHKIRKQADVVYNKLRKLFKTPEGLSFWEFFTERVAQFKKATEKLSSDEVLEMVYEPLEMSVPTSHTMKAAVDAANEQEKEEEEEEETKKAKSTPAKTKKALNSTPSKTPAKRQSSRNKPEEKEKEQTNTEEIAEADTEQNQEVQNKEKESKENDTEEKQVATDKREKKNTKNGKPNKEDNKSKDKDSKEKETKDKNDTEEKDSSVKDKTPEKTDDNTDGSAKESSVEEKKGSSKEISKETEKESKSVEKDSKSTEKDSKSSDKDGKSSEKNSKSTEKNSKSTEKESKSAEKDRKSAEKERKSVEKDRKSVEKDRKSAEKESKSTEKDSKNTEKDRKSVEKDSKNSEKESKSAEKSDKEDKEKAEDEPRAKRSRESKKTDPPPRSPTKRKSKF